MKIRIFVVLTACLAVAMVASPWWGTARAVGGIDPAQEVLEVSRRFQNAGIRGDRAVLTQIFSPSVTHFHPGAPYRFVGRDRLVQEFEAASKTQQDMRFEAVDPQVQMVGSSAAIVTYYIVESWADKNGVRTSVKEKATEVYSKVDGSWTMLHSHYSTE